MQTDTTESGIKYLPFWIYSVDLKANEAPKMSEQLSMSETYVCPCRAACPSKLPQQFIPQREERISRSTRTGGGMKMAKGKETGAPAQPVWNTVKHWCYLCVQLEVPTAD